MLYFYFLLITFGSNRITNLPGIESEWVNVESRANEMQFKFVFVQQWEVPAAHAMNDFNKIKTQERRIDMEIN